MFNGARGRLKVRCVRLKTTPDDPAAVSFAAAQWIFRSATDFDWARGEGADGDGCRGGLGFTAGAVAAIWSAQAAPCTRVADAVHLITSSRTATALSGVPVTWHAVQPRGRPAVPDFSPFSGRV